MDRSLIGTLWTNGQGKYFEITDLSFDNEHVIVYYRNTANNEMTYSCYFEAFESRFTQDFQKQNATYLKSKFGLII